MFLEEFLDVFYFLINLVWSWKTSPEIVDNTSAARYCSEGQYQRDYFVRNLIDCVFAAVVNVCAAQKSAIVTCVDEQTDLCDVTRQNK